MLLVSGLLTLLAIAHAGGDHIKGGSHHIKGGASTIAQEAVVQEDIKQSPYNFNIKTGPAWGTKLTREETGDSDGRVIGSYSISNPRGTSRVVQYHADDTGFHASVKTSEPNIKTHSPANAQIQAVSKTAPAPVVHHAVKTISEEDGKLHSAPGLHHAASVPVVQDQVPVDEPTVADDSSSRIKTFQAEPSGRTRFSSKDLPLRDPIARPVTKSVTTIKDTSRDSSQGIKSASTRQRQFTYQDVQGRDSTLGPIIKTVKTVADPATQVASISTQSPIKSIKVPNQSNIKSTSATSNSAVKTSQIKTDYGRTPAISESIAAGRRYNLGTSSSYYSERTPSKDRNAVRQLSASGPQQAGLKLVNENGEIIIDEDMFKALQSIGGVQNENGEIILNEEAMQLIQKMGGNISGQRSAISLSSFDRVSKETVSLDQEKLLKKKPVRLYNTDKLRTPGTGNRVSSSQATRGSLSTRIDTSYLTSERKPVSGISQATATVSQNAFANRERGQSVFSSQSDTVLFEGKEIRIDGLKEGQLFDENLRPILSANIGSARQGARAPAATQDVKPVTRTRVTQNDATLSRTSAVQGSTGLLQGGISNQERSRQQGETLTGGLLTSSQVTRGSVPGRVDTRYLTSARKPVSGISQSSAAGSQNEFANRQTGQSVYSSQSDTVLFDGKEILLDGLKEGQLFDENLKPILSTNIGSLRQGSRASIASQGVKPATRTRVTQNVATLSRTDAIQGSSGTLQGGISQQDRTGQQGATLTGGRLTSSQVSRGSVTGIIDTRYLSSARKPISGTSQTTASGSESAFGNRQTGQSVFSSQSDTVLFEGKEISLDGLKEGQLFDENLKPILSADAGSIRQGAGASAASQGGKPASRTRLAQDFTTISRTNVIQGSIGALQGGISRQDTIRQQGATFTGGSLTSPEATRGSVSGRVDTSYLTGARKPISDTPLTTATGSQSAFANRQTGQSVFESQSDTVLFDGKEIRLDGLKEGQLFDENLRPILSANAGRVGQGIGASAASQGVKPATRTMVAQNVATLSRTNAIQGSSGTLQGGISQQARTRQQGATLTGGRLTSSQASTGSVTGIIDTRYLTSARKPISGTSQTTATRSQGAFGNRQTGQSIFSSQSDTVLFDGKEIRLDGLKEGQLFDENLRPILSTNTGSVRPGTGASVASQGVKPATRTRVTQNVATLSRTNAIQGSSGTLQGGISQQDRIGQQGATLTGGHLTSSQVTRGSVSGRVDTRYLTSARKPVSGVSQPTVTGSQNEFGNRLTGQSVFSSQSDTVLFDGKEIRLDGLKEGQLFDENLRPILSANAGSVRTGTGASGPSQGVKPATRTRVTQNVATLSRTNAIQGSSGTLQGGISQQDRTRQQGATFTGGRLPYSQTTRDSVSGKVGTRYLTSSRKPVSGVSQPTVTGSQNEFGNRQTGQSVFSSQSDTVLFDGKEIRLDGLKEGQLFDENLRPILSANVGSVRPGTGASGASQDVKPATRTRVTQNIATLSRTNAIQDSSGTLQGGISQQDRTRQQGATFTGGRLPYSQTTRDSVSGKVGTRYLTSSQNPGYVTTQTTSTGSQDSFANSLTGQSDLLSKADTVFFNGKEIRIDGLREGQLFDENLNPILSANTGNVQQGTDVSVRSEATKPSSLSRGTQNVGSFSRTGVAQTSRGIVIGGMPFMYNIPQRTNLQEITQDEIGSKVIQQKVDPRYDEQQKIVQESFIESGSVKTPVSEFSQKAVDPSESKQTQLKVEDVLEQRPFSVPDSSKHIQVQERVPIAVAESTALPKSLSKTTNAKVTQVIQEHIDDPAIQQQPSDEDISGYIPDVSFLPTFNYGIPRNPVLNSGLKTSTVHEQQKVEQVFV